MIKRTTVLYFLTFALTSFKTDDDKVVFGNGRYRVDSTWRESGDYEIEIIGDKYVKHLPNAKKEGAISRVGPELYHFDDKADSTIEVKDVLLREIKRAYGEKRLEVKKTGRNKIVFRTTYQGNLHLTLDEGVFIKKKGS